MILRCFVGIFFSLTLVQTSFAERVDIQPRIIGGTVADWDNEDYSFMVALTQIKTVATGWKYGWFCGGTLVSDEWVLTAAHCFDNGWDFDNSDNISNQLIIGVSDLNEQSQSNLFMADYIYIHKGYSTDANNGKAANDIALIHLARKVPSDVAKPIGVDGNSVETLDGLRILGWGQTEYNNISSTSTTLLRADVEVYDTSQCESSLGDYDENLMFCAGRWAGGIDTCQGDSGGPIVKRYLDGSWRLTGVTSWGYKCGFARYPGVYARASYYFSLINQVIVLGQQPSNFVKRDVSWVGSSTPGSINDDNTTNPSNDDDSSSGNGAVSWDMWFAWFLLLAARRFK